MAKLTFNVLLLWAFVVTFTYGADKGFEFQYTTNRQEYLNYPVQFEHPLPRWLKGVYVSIIELVIGAYSCFGFSSNCEKSCFLYVLYIGSVGCIALAVGIAGNIGVML